jgi:arylsulfatase B
MYCRKRNIIGERLALVIRQRAVRAMCRTRIAFLAAAIGLGVAFAAPAAPADSSTAAPPNIVLIVADDLGWNAVGYNGSFVRTPNIDRLAGQGVQLTNFYVSPMCSPTRAGLMTGRYPMRLGMARSVVRPWAAFGLPPRERTLPEALATVGYAHRGIFGKWHLGHLDPVWHPLSQGFTEFRGQYNGAADYWTRVRDGEPDWHDNAEPLQASGYTTDLIADAACAFIKRNAAQGPFFCYVPFTAPHDPLQVPDHYLAAYPATAPAGGDPVARDRRKLAAMVTCMDDGIGRILQALRDGGIAEQTVVWFLSDNGGVNRLHLNGALRDGKLTVYEGGVRVPSAVWWPGKIEGGRKVDKPLINLDVMPTLLRLAGAPPVPGIDGVDASELLRGRSDSLPQRDLFFFIGQSGLDREQIAIRSADGWKMVVVGLDIRRPGGYRTPQHKVELFRLIDDPFERHDVASANPEVIQKLGDKLIAFRSAEPAGTTSTPNQSPPEFKPPKQWRNRPVAQPSN